MYNLHGIILFHGFLRFPFYQTLLWKFCLKCFHRSPCKASMISMFFEWSQTRISYFQTAEMAIESFPFDFLDLQKMIFNTFEDYLELVPNWSKHWKDFFYFFNSFKTIKFKFLRKQFRGYLIPNLKTKHQNYINC